MTEKAAGIERSQVEAIRELVEKHKRKAVNEEEPIIPPLKKRKRSGSGSSVTR